MILVNPNLDLKVENCISDKSGRFIILDLIVDESRIILVNIYASNDANQQVAFFKDLQNRLAYYAQENIIEKDKKGGNSVLKKSRVIKEIDHFINPYNLSDIWRFNALHGETSLSKSAAG